MNRLVVVCVAVILLVVVLVAVVLFGPALQSDMLHISDYRNDVLFNIGSSCHGMVDLEGANFTRIGGVANITLKVAEPFDLLGSDEFATWEFLVVLENETDVLQTYIISVEADSSGFSGSFYDVSAFEEESFDVAPSGQWLSLLVPLDEIGSASMVEWHVEAFYEAYSGLDVVADAYDVAPNEGLQATELEP